MQGRQWRLFASGALVWLESRAEPTQLREVQVGDRILCLDTLGGMRYVEVEAAAFRFEALDECVTVKLADGSQVEVTAGHPMDRRRGGHVRGVIPARELRARDDSIVVLKPVEVAVSEVIFGASWKQSSQDSRESGKRFEEVAEVVVKQPDRYSILVQPPGPKDALSPGLAAALRSADPGATAWKFKVDRTFLQVVREPEGLGRRTSSAPPQFRTDASGHQRSRKASSTIVQSHESPPSLYESSLSRSQPSSIEDMNIIVAGPGEQGSEFRLTELLQVRSKGLASKGASEHAAGRCQVCRVHNSKGKACNKGAFCTFCHDQHDTVSRRGGRAGRSRATFVKGVRLGSPGETAAANDEAL